MKVKEAGIRIRLYMRYMDDGRKFLQPIRRGWRWLDGKLMFSKRWELEDNDKSPLQMTVEVLKETVKGVAEYLNFTFETGQDFEDGWLPTLDTNLRVTEGNQVEYKYFEKPTTTNTTLRKTTAMNENTKIQCLANDLVRRLLNTRAELPSMYREEVVNGYATKLLSSGYDREQVKRILLSGMRGYVAKKKRRQASGRRRIHDTAMESRGTRARKKLIGKTSWYRDRKKEDRSKVGKRGTKEDWKRLHQD